MKRIILALLILCSTLPAFAQPASGDILGPVGGPTDIWFTGCLLTSQRQMRMTYSDTLVLLYNPAGSFRFDTTRQLMRVYDGARWRRMVDSAYLDTVIAGVEAGVADTAQFIASIYRLNREIDSVSNITDSLYTVLRTKQGADSLLLAGHIATLQSDVVVLDSAIGAAFDALSALYDTLPNYVDTAMLNDSLQVVKARDVPYTGATTDVNLGTHNLLTNSVRLSTSPTGTLTNVGQLYWDAANVAPSVPLNANVTLQMGQEMYIRARNNTGAQINDGQVVYVNDAQGNNPTIALANSDSVNTSIVVGVATENIAINATGFVTTFGIVNGFNTSTFNDGDALYLNTVSGQLSNTIPTPPHNVVKVGIALNNTNNGKIFVQPSAPLGQDTTFAAPYNSDKVAPTQRSIGTYTRKIVRDTASALRTAINAKYGTSDTGRAATNIVTGGGLNKVRDSLNTLIAAKGSGSVTSITGGYGLTGGTITTTGTFAVDSNLQATRARVKKQIDSVAALSGGGSTPTTTVNYKVLYKSGDSIKAASKVNIDTTDGRMVLEQNADTSSVSAYYGGGTKIVGRNRMGMSSLVLVDTVAIPAALQRALNAQITSTLMPNTTILTGAGATGNYSIDAPISIMPTTSPLVTNVVGAYNSTIQHLNFTKLIITTQTTSNISAGMRVNSNLKPIGLITGNTKFSGGGGRGTFTFSFPTYNAGQRIFIGYSVLFSQPNTDPSTFLQANSGIGIGKDATDTELQFFHSNNVTTPTKVSTGITPNAEDVYRVTVYVAPNSTYYIQLEVLNKNRITARALNPITNVPPVGIKLYPMQYINNATTGAAIQYGFIYATEEIY